jgi:hypothetical protein
MLYEGEHDVVSESGSENVLQCISSDVLSDNRVNVAEEKSERVIWYKVCGRPLPRSMYHILSQSTVTGKVLDGQ